MFSTIEALTDITVTLANLVRRLAGRLEQLDALSEEEAKEIEDTLAKQSGAVESAF